MTLEATPITQTESTPFLVREAAKYIPVGVYLDLRQTNAFWLNDSERYQLNAANYKLDQLSSTDYGKLSPAAETPTPSTAPFIPKVILSQVPLDQYLSAHSSVIEAMIDRIDKQALAGEESPEESISWYTEWNPRPITKTDIKRQNLKQELDLTKIIAEVVRGS
ncbi:MAG: hypothetical protein Q8P47_02780 [Candidatus Beckwithbacteria bacterium]|nr:hypothetical protein [Candidatus Beckwithbacteria bacterium]